MADIEIELNKKNKSDIDATIKFDTYGEVIEFESDDIYSSGTETDIELNPECIEIEISGLKTIDAFIGLTDTPLYYENGKFFKVLDNKIVYTDITWSDIIGEISENPVLEEQVKEIAKLYSEKYVKETVNNSIDIHDKDANAHEFIQNIIRDNYTSLDNKIDINKNELINSINSLNNDVVKNADDIDTLFQEQAKDVENITEIKSDIQNINSSLEELDKEIVDINLRIDDNKNDISDINNTIINNYDELNGLISNNAENIEINSQTINDLRSDLEVNYTKKEELSNVSFTGDYNDLINLPIIPSLEGYATTEYVEDKLSEAIAQVEKFDFILVDELPEQGESNHIYLVLHEHGESDIYDEYIWIESTQSFEKIGNTDIDLSGFYNKKEVDDFLSNKVDKVDGYSLILETEIERLGTLYNYDDTEVRNLINTKQDNLTAGENISINKDEETGLTTISAIDTVYTAGEGISIENNIITNTNISAEWGNIVGDINSQVDLQDILNSKIDTDTFNTELNKKQDVLTAGNGITIEENIINGTVITFRDWSV